MKIVLDGERPSSWNKFYSGSHWGKRKKMVDRIHELVRASLPHDYELYEQPVAIIVIAYFKNRPLDCDNITAKLYIDALCGHVIHDDTPRFLDRVTTISRLSKTNPRVEIIIDEI